MNVPFAKCTTTHMRVAYMNGNARRVAYRVSRVALRIAYRSARSAPALSLVFPKVPSPVRSKTTERVDDWARATRIPFKSKLLGRRLR